MRVGSWPQFVASVRRLHRQRPRRVRGRRPSSTTADGPAGSSASRRRDGRRRRPRRSRRPHRSRASASTAGFVVGAAATVRQGDVVRTYLVTAVDPVTRTVDVGPAAAPDFDTTLAIDVAHRRGGGPRRAARRRRGRRAARSPPRAPAAGATASRCVARPSGGDDGATAPTSRRRLGHARGDRPPGSRRRPVPAQPGLGGDGRRRDRSSSRRSTRRRALLTWTTPLPADDRPHAALHPRDDDDVRPRGPRARRRRRGLAGPVAAAGAPALRRRPCSRHPPAVACRGARRPSRRPLSRVRARGGRDGTAALTIDRPARRRARRRRSRRSRRDRAIDEPALRRRPRPRRRPPTPALVAAAAAEPPDPCDPCRHRRGGARRR